MTFRKVLDIIKNMKLIERLIFRILAGILGIFLATKWITGVNLKIPPGESQIKLFLFIGIAFGIVNFFIKPFLELLTFPFRILTFGLSSLIINMILVWIIDVIFPELEILGVYSLFLTTLILWGLNFFLRI